VTISCPDCLGLYGAASTDDPMLDDQLDGYLGGASLSSTVFNGRGRKKHFRQAMIELFSRR
jgi:hypothetical protein